MIGDYFYLALFINNIYIPTSPGLVIIALHDDLFPTSEGCGGGEIFCCWPGSDGCCGDVDTGVVAVTHCVGDEFV